MMFLFALLSAESPPGSLLVRPLLTWPDEHPHQFGPDKHRVRRAKGCAVAAQRSGEAAITYPGYLHTAEVADLLHVSPKTVSRWAKEGKLPS